MRSSTLVSLGLPGRQASRVGGLGEELQVLLLEGLQLAGDAHVLGELAAPRQRRPCGTPPGSWRHALATPMARAISRYFSPVQSALYSMTMGSIMAQATPWGGVIHGAQGVGHGVGDAQAYVGEAHAGDVLAQSHARRGPPWCYRQRRRAGILEMISMALRWNMSVISQAALVV